MTPETTIPVLPPSAVPETASCAAAVRAWRQAVGDAWVSTDPAACSRLARTTSRPGHRPVAVVRPGSVDEVQAVVRAAAACRVPVHPVSRGKNWGYGDGAPPGPGQAVLDLARLDRIISVDEELAVAVVEPGVTQGQLAAHLRASGGRLWSDVTGAGPDASVVGNALERGFGHTPYGDHTATWCGLDAVLGDGRLVSTGTGRFPGARATHAYPYGLGPAVGGLFAQSNLGVVVRMGVWLMPAPATLAAFVVRAETDTELAVLFGRLAALRRAGVVRSCVHVANDLRAASSSVPYPWDLAGPSGGLSDAARAAFRRRAGVAAWTAVGAVYGSHGVVAATCRDVARGLRPFRVRFVTERRLAWARRAAGWAARLGVGAAVGQRIRAVEGVWRLLKGDPAWDHVRGASWRVRITPGPGPADPVETGAGLQWASPALPATGVDAAAVATVLAERYRAYGFDPLVTFTLVGDRAAVCVSNASYDRSVAEEVARAEACHDDVVARLVAAGYPPYRVGPAAYSVAAPGADAHGDLVRAVKRAADPQGIISPGRYGIA